MTNCFCAHSNVILVFISLIAFTTREINIKIAPPWALKQFVARIHTLFFMYVRREAIILFGYNSYQIRSRKTTLNISILSVVFRDRIWWTFSFTEMSLKLLSTMSTQNNPLSCVGSVAYEWQSLAHIHWNGHVVRVTALVFNGDVEACLQRLQWISGRSSFPFQCTFMALKHQLIIMLALSSITVATTYGTTRDDKACIMMALSFSGSSVEGGKKCLLFSVVFSLNE